MGLLVQDVSDLDKSVRNFTSITRLSAALVVGSLASVILIPMHRNGPLGANIVATDISFLLYVVLAALAIGALLFGKLRQRWLTRLLLLAAAGALAAAAWYELLPTRFDAPAWISWWVANIAGLALFFFVFLLIVSRTANHWAKAVILTVLQGQLLLWAVVEASRMFELGGYQTWIPLYAACAAIFLYVSFKLAGALADYDALCNEREGFLFYPIGYSGHSRPLAALTHFLGARLYIQSSAWRQVLSTLLIVLAIAALGIAMRTFTLLFFEIGSAHGMAPFFCGRDTACISARGLEQLMTQAWAVPAFLIVPFLVFLSLRASAWFVLRTTAASVLKKRWPPALLFLRPFSEGGGGDRVTLRSEPRSLLERVFGGARSYGNLDQLLVDECADLGSVVALGRPGQRIPPSGAAREYVSHDVWQDVVSRRALEARGVVLCLGSSQGVQWEVDFVTSNPELRKRLLVLSHPEAFDHPTHEALLARVLAAYELDLDDLEEEPDRVIALIGYPKGLVVVASDRRDEGSYQMAIRLFLERNSMVLAEDIQVARMQLALEGLREFTARLDRSQD